MPRRAALDQEAKKTLDRFREQVQVTRTLSNLSSFSGIVAIPFIFVGILAPNQALGAASLCWLVSHFVGYITRMLQEEHRQAVMRFEMAELTFRAKSKPGDDMLPRSVSLN